MLNPESGMNFLEKFDCGLKVLSKWAAREDENEFILLVSLCIFSFFCSPRIILLTEKEDQLLTIGRRDWGYVPARTLGL